jgi:hypothetical protein
MIQRKLKSEKLGYFNMRKVDDDDDDDGTT